MIGGQFTNLGLYNRNTSTYDTWGINTARVTDAWKVSPERITLSYHNLLSQSFLMLGYILCVLITVGSKVLSTLFHNRFQYSMAQLDYLFTYTSPTVLGAAVFLFLLFRNISIRRIIAIRMLKFCSPLSFGVYLIHTHPSVWNNLLSNRFSIFANYSSLLCVILVLLSAVTIFFVCILVDFLRYALIHRLKLT